MPAKLHQRVNLKIFSGIDAPSRAPLHLCTRFDQFDGSGEGRARAYRVR